MASLIFLLLLLAAAVAALVNYRRSGSPFLALFAFGIFWFFIAVSVESFMVPIQDVIFEHRAYLPSVGVLVAFTALIFYAFEVLKERYAPALSIGVFTAVVTAVTAVPLAAALVERNGMWADDVAFLNDNLEKTPGSAAIYYMRGIAYMERGEYDKAVEDYTVTIRLKPELEEAYNNRAIAHSSAGRYDEALKDLDTALAIGPEKVRVYLNRAFTHVLLDDCASAVADIGRARELNGPLAEQYLSSPFLSEAISELSEECMGKGG
jgi:tetratricopeptide (TPR) repeat protein